MLCALMSLADTNRTKFPRFAAQQSLRFHSCTKSMRRCAPKSTCHQSCAARACGLRHRSVGEVAVGIAVHRVHGVAARRQGGLRGELPEGDIDGGRCGGGIQPLGGHRDHGGSARRQPLQLHLGTAEVLVVFDGDGVALSRDPVERRGVGRRRVIGPVVDDQGRCRSTRARRRRTRC